MPELLATMTASEFETWREYDRLEPFGAIRDNIHAAIVALTLRAVNARKGAQLPTLADFLVLPPAERQTRQVSGAFAALKAIAVPKGTGKRKGKEHARAHRKTSVGKTP